MGESVVRYRNRLCEVVEVGGVLYVERSSDGHVIVEMEASDRNLTAAIGHADRFAGPPRR